MDHELTRLFGTSARSHHIQTYTDNPSEEWMKTEMRRLRRLSLELGMDVKFAVRGNEIAMGFTDLFQSATFRIKAYGEGVDAGQHTHEESFTNSSPLYQKQWARAAQDLLAKKGIAPEVSITKDKVELKFTSLREMAIFSALRDSGQIEPAKPRLSLVDRAFT